MINSNKPAQVEKLKKEARFNDFDARLLNAGKDNATMIIAIMDANNVYNNASARNCPINCFRSEPNTFLIPTSFALFADCAVAKFIKLTQASSMINNAIAEKLYTYLISA